MTRRLVHDLAYPAGTIGVVPRWICPRCDREFGAARQAHVCVPGITVATLLSRHPAWVGEIYAAIVAELETLGPFHEDAVDVGIFVKSDRKLAEFRPRVRSARLSLFLPDRLEDSRVAHVLPVAADRFVVGFNLTTAAEVDDQVRRWIDEAYDFNTD
jgi:hypothetical protein